MDNFIPVLALLTIPAGLLLTTAFTTVNIHSGTPRYGIILFGLSALVLTGTSLAFYLAGLAAHPSGAIGIPLTFIGQCLWIIGVFYIAAHPTREFRQPFTPLGSFAISIGMILTGIAVLNSNRLGSIWRYMPLMTGLFFLVQFPVQAIFFIRKRGFPSYRILSLWGILWALSGIALLTMVRI
jgi:hypothetical protein